MMVTTKRRIVEEEVTEVVSVDNMLDNLMKHRREEREVQERLEQQERERMRHENNRLVSFPSYWLDSQCLAKAGFYYYNHDTTCFSCELWKPESFWDERHDPEAVHREARPNCKFVTGQSDNVTIEKEREQMKYEKNRLDSFPPGLFPHQLAQRLVKAGFYYSMYLCGTKCFSCGLWKHWSFWEEGHDPETVHREASPDCEFINGQSDNVPMHKSMFRKFLDYANPKNKKSIQNAQDKQNNNNETKLQQTDKDTDAKQNKRVNEKWKPKKSQKPTSPGEHITPKVHVTPEAHVTPEEHVTSNDHLDNEQVTPEADVTPKKQVTPKAHVTPDDHIDHGQVIPKERITSKAHVTAEEYLTPEEQVTREQHVTPTEQLAHETFTGNTDVQRENVRVHNILKIYALN